MRWHVAMRSPQRVNLPYPLRNIFVPRLLACGVCLPILSLDFFFIFCLKAQFVNNSVSNNTLATFSFCWLFSHFFPCTFLPSVTSVESSWVGMGRRSQGAPGQCFLGHNSDLATGVQWPWRRQIFPFFFFLAELMGKCFNKGRNMMKGDLERKEQRR